MSIQFTTTDDIFKFVKVLVYGRSGVGKTDLIRTAPSPIIISSENKLATLHGTGIKVIKVKSIQDFEDALEFIHSKKGKKFQTICIDSISDVAERAILADKPNHKDPRRAYGVVQDKMFTLIRQAHDHDEKNLYIIAKSKRYEDEDGFSQFAPKMPGQQMGPELPFLFDNILPLRFKRKTKKSKGYRYLQTNLEHDPSWDAKTVGDLPSTVEPNLKKLFGQIKKAAKQKRK